MYLISQKRSTCSPGGFSVILAIMPQVKEYSGDLQITNVNLQVQKITLLFYILLLFYLTHYEFTLCSLKSAENVKNYQNRECLYFQR